MIQKNIDYVLFWKRVALKKATPPLFYLIIYNLVSTDSRAQVFLQASCIGMSLFVSFQHLQFLCFSFPLKLEMKKIHALR